MARIILIISRSGTGKTSSIRNLKKDEVSVISCSGKELPFKNNLKTFIPKNYSEVYGAIRAVQTPVVVIDDINYLMSFEEMARVQEIGYAKFTQMASNMFNVFKAIIDKDSNQTFYVMAHAAETDDGTLRLKTTGKMLSDKIVIEGLTNILLTTEITADGEFIFRVRTDGTGVKSPIGMFKEPTMENDLRIVNNAIDKFYAKEGVTK